MDLFPSDGEEKKFHQPVPFLYDLLKSLVQHGELVLHNCHLLVHLSWFQHQNFRNEAI